MRGSSQWIRAMRRFLNTKVGRDFLRMFIILAILILGVVGFGIHHTLAALKAQTGITLRATSNGAEAQLREFLLRIKDQTLSLSTDTDVRNILLEAPKTEQLGNAVLVSLRATLPEAREILVLSADGRVVASSRGASVGMQHGSETFFTEGQRAFYPGDIVRDPAGEITWLVSAPIRHLQNNRSIGVLAIRLDPAALSDLTAGRRILAQGADTQSFRIGDTGETYIVNQDGYMITESRYIPDSILKLKVDTLPVRTARDEGREITADYTDYRGIRVSGDSVILRNRDWILVTEIDFSQAFTPIKQLRNWLSVVAAALVASGLVLAGIWAKGILEPLRMIGDADASLAAGNEAAGITPEEKLPSNEIGEFVRRRNRRVKVLLERQRELVQEQKRSAEAAEELERMSYSIVHDMRAPLRAIAVFGDLIEADAAEVLTADTRGYLARMKSAAARMDHLITDLLSYSTLVRVQLPLHAVDVRSLLMDMIETYPFLHAHKQHIQIPDQVPAVQGNEAALTQCFSSLLDNALKFTKPGQTPHVRIRAEENNGWVRISVEDEGVGVARQWRARMYGIFQRGSNDQDGNGIGLAIVRIAATRMGGQVGVESEEGKGARFWIELRSASGKPAQ